MTPSHLSPQNPGTTMAPPACPWTPVDLYPSASLQSTSGQHGLVPQKEPLLPMGQWHILLFMALLSGAPEGRLRKP